MSSDSRDDGTGSNRFVPALLEGRGASVGELLVRDKVVSLESLEAAGEEMQRTGESLFYALTKLGLVRQQTLTQYLSRTYSLPEIDFESSDFVEESAVRMLPRDFCEKHGVMPIAVQGNELVVVISDPTYMTIMDDIKFMTNHDVSLTIASEEAIRRAIDRHYGLLEGDSISAQIDQHFQGMSSELELDTSVEGDVDVFDLEHESAQQPIVRLVNLLLLDALRRQASDIHIETYDKMLRVRYRIDGVLHEIVRPPAKFAPAIASRIKVMSQLDIADRRMPQDGRMKIRIPSERSQPRECSFRVSVAPFHHGEKVVLRLLDATNLQTDMTRLGFEPDELQRFQSAIHQPFGMVLVTGPTGSGKTTTLYSALAELNGVGENISTIEDPIEFELLGVNQMQINEAVGLTFAHALRSFLRQDPDIIMVGEIRDFETVEIAIKAALTGHLLLSTLHTNDASSAITRLTNMGVEAFMVAEALNMVVAQRLVRRTCPECRRPHQYTHEDCMAAGMSEEMYASATFMVGQGCTTCSNTGLRGRIAVYEILSVGDAMQEAIVQGQTGSELKRLAMREGMRTLRQSALAQCAAGRTTLDEVLRVTRAD